MTTPLLCLIAVAILPYILAGTGAALRIRQLGSLDNAEPRIQAEELTGAAARALHAQANAWEAVAFFGTAVVVAHLAGADPEKSAFVAMIYVGARVLHGVFYIANIPILRTAVFLVSAVCCFRLFFLATAA